VRNGFQKSFAAGLEGLRKVGFLLGLVAGSAVLGFLIAWPLWLFATSARQVYTITVLALAGAGIVFLAVRAARRRQKARRDAGKPGLGLLPVLLTVLLVLVGISGAYLGAALFVRGLWVVGVGVLVLWAGLLWLVGRARRAAKGRKVRRVPAENGSE
jgi:small-conductance mechanosensitive channel